MSKKRSDKVQFLARFLRAFYRMNTYLKICSIIKGKSKGIGTKNSDAFCFHITLKKFYKAANRQKHMRLCFSF